MRTPSSRVYVFSLLYFAVRLFTLKKIKLKKQAASSIKMYSKHYNIPNNPLKQYKRDSIKQEQVPIESHKNE